MFASVEGTSPGYMTHAPHTLAPRYVSLSSILGNNRATRSENSSGWPSSAEALARMDSGYPEYMANLKPILRWAP